MSLSSKHALITGSSRGIGRGIALELAERGANVAVHYYQNEAAARETLAQVRERGVEGLGDRGGRRGIVDEPRSAARDSAWIAP